MVRHSSLELRSAPWVILAYLFSPLVALTVVSACVLISLGYTFRDSQQQAAFLLIVSVGEAVCVVTELLFITPLLVGFRLYRWRWLNGWSAAAVGSVLGFALPLAMGMIGNRDLDGMVISSLAGTSAFAGGVGLISAVIFCLIAVRKRHDEAAAQVNESAAIAAHSLGSS